jgi:hypothetical protein
VAQDGPAADQAVAEEPAAQARSDSPHRLFALADGIFAIDPDTRLSTLVRPLFNVGIFLLAVPTAFALTNTDAGSGYSPLIWLLLLFDVRFSRLVIGSLRRRR